MCACSCINGWINQTLSVIRLSSKYCSQRIVTATEICVLKNNPPIRLLGGNQCNAVIFTLWEQRWSSLINHYNCDCAALWILPTDLPIKCFHKTLFCNTVLLLSLTQTPQVMWKQFLHLFHSIKVELQWLSDCCLNMHIYIFPVKTGS